MKSIGEYIKNETPEQRKSRTDHARASRWKNKLSRAIEKTNGSGSVRLRNMSGFKINVTIFEDGVYSKKTSKTILIPNPNFTRDDLIRAIVDSTKLLRSGFKNNSKKERAIVI